MIHPAIFHKILCYITVTLFSFSFYLVLSFYLFYFKNEFIWPNFDFVVVFGWFFLFDLSSIELFRINLSWCQICNSSTFSLPMSGQEEENFLAWSFQILTAYGRITWSAWTKRKHQQKQRKKRYNYMTVSYLKIFDSFLPAFLALIKLNEHRALKAQYILIQDYNSMWRRRSSVWPNIYVSDKKQERISLAYCFHSSGKYSS